MPRLITFGCSYTFGEALPDIHPLLPPKDRVPSKFAWPNLLSNKLGYECLNLAECGSGNFQILIKVLKTKFLPDDLVIISWSHFSRYDFYKILNSDYEGRQIHENNPLFKKIIFNTRVNDIEWKLNYQIKNWLCISHVCLLLETLKIKNYFFTQSADWENEKIPDFIPTKNRLDVGNGYLIDKALDNGHPGLESHKLLASQLYDKINQ